MPSVVVRSPDMRRMRGTWRDIGTGEYRRPMTDDRVERVAAVLLGATPVRSALTALLVRAAADARTIVAELG